MRNRTFAAHEAHTCARWVTFQLLSLCFVLVLGSCHDKPKDAGSEDVKITASTPADTLQNLVSQVRKCSRLYTASFKVHRIITHADQLKLKGCILSKDFSINIPAGDRKVAIPIDATLKGYIDFSKFTDQNVIYDDGRVEIILPDPEVELTSTKIVHDKVNAQVSWFRSDFTDEELSYYEKQGRQSIIESVPEMQVVDRSRASAAHILIPLVSQLGFDKDSITITFRKDLNVNALKIVTLSH